jgi:hypothetical protein
MSIGIDELPSNGLPFSCRERAAETSSKIPTISRAKRSAATAGWVADRSDPVVYQG